MQEIEVFTPTDTLKILSQPIFIELTVFTSDTRAPEETVWFDVEG